MHTGCSKGSFYELKKGETLADIIPAGADINGFLAANPYLNPLYYLSGQVVVIPHASEPPCGKYTIAYGETLYDVLRKTNISAAELMAANPETDIFRLSAGMQLELPLKQVDNRCFYTLKQGEDLKSVAAKYAISINELLRLNTNLRPSEFTCGQTVRVSN